MAVPRPPLGGISSIFADDRMGHDPHDADMLRSCICSCVSKKHVAGHHSPHRGEQRNLNWNSSWYRELTGVALANLRLHSGLLGCKVVRRSHRARRNMPVHFRFCAKSPMDLASAPVHPSNSKPLVSDG